MSGKYETSLKCYPSEGEIFENFAESPKIFLFYFFTRQSSFYVMFLKCKLSPTRKFYFANFNFLRSSNLCINNGKEF